MRGRRSCKYVTGSEEQLVKFQLVRKMWKGLDERKHASTIQIKVSISGAMLFWASEAGAMCTITGVEGSRLQPERMRILRGHTNNHDNC